MTLPATKEQLRAEIRRQRREFAPAARARANRTIHSRLESLPLWQRAGCVQTYVSLPPEVDTHALIRRLLHAGKRVAVPRVAAENLLQPYFITAWADLQTGAFGILEPRLDSAQRATAETFDLVLVPGLAFDRAGNRLGAGKGYYDRFLAAITAPKIALAFAFQLVEQIPIAPHDQSVDMIVTEEELIACR